MCSDVAALWAKGTASTSETVNFTLPWPEIPLLSTSEQHRVQRGEVTEPSNIQCTNPGAIELEGKVRHLLQGSLQQAGLHTSQVPRVQIAEASIWSWGGMGPQAMLSVTAPDIPRARQSPGPRQGQLLDSVPSSVVSTGPSTGCSGLRKWGEVQSEAFLTGGSEVQLPGCEL